MNKQKLLKQVGGLPSTLLDKRVLVDKSAILGLIEQLDEPQKVTIPKFVADWIEDCKRNGISLYRAMHRSIEINKWLDCEDNEEIFARVWLDGYEVEREKLYTISLPNDQPLVKKNNTLFFNQDLAELPAKLTEAEIKQGFDWAWQWAEEVE